MIKRIDSKIVTELRKKKEDRSKLDKLIAILIQKGIITKDELK